MIHCVGESKIISFILLFWLALSLHRSRNHKSFFITLLTAQGKAACLCLANLFVFHLPTYVRIIIMCTRNDTMRCGSNNHMSDIDAQTENYPFEKFSWIFLAQTCYRSLNFFNFRWFLIGCSCVGKIHPLDTIMCMDYHHELIS